MVAQATAKPELDGRSGDICTHLAARVSDPCAVGAEPRPACAAERQYRRARLDDLRSIRRLKAQRPCSSQPVQRCARKFYAHRSSRRSHARSKGDALKAFGNTRPLEPMKVSCPALRSSRATLAAGTLDRSFQMRHRLAVAREECGNGSLWVRLSPPRPAIRNLRPADGIAS